ncbi:hypothetical protein BDW59DRAFT_166346 [Aspergillus cavernicola]|uniref:BZIP domain-containing protein n=1 Tax=Aspergillus cavernicola TaxID=176166 RepID=A0ABR4HLQ6_9EURO
MSSSRNGEPSQRGVRSKKAIDWRPDSKRTASNKADLWLPKRVDAFLEPPGPMASTPKAHTPEFSGAEDPLAELFEDATTDLFEDPLTKLPEDLLADPPEDPIFSNLLSDTSVSEMFADALTNHLIPIDPVNDNMELTNTDIQLDFDSSMNWLAENDVSQADTTGDVSVNEPVTTVDPPKNRLMPDNASIVDLTLSASPRPTNQQPASYVYAPPRPNIPRITNAYVGQGSATDIYQQIPPSRPTVPMGPINRQAINPPPMQQPPMLHPYPYPRPLIEMTREDAVMELLQATRFIEQLQKEKAEDKRRILATSRRVMVLEASAGASGLQDAWREVDVLKGKLKRLKAAVKYQRDYFDDMMREKR